LDVRHHASTQCTPICGWKYRRFVFCLRCQFNVGSNAPLTAATISYMGIHHFDSFQRASVLYSTSQCPKSEAVSASKLSVFGGVLSYASSRFSSSCSSFLAFRMRIRCCLCCINHNSVYPCSSFPMADGKAWQIRWMMPNNALHLTALTLSASSVRFWFSIFTFLSLIVGFRRAVGELLR
jgi:hypothetical protein